MSIFFRVWARWRLFRYCRLEVRRNLRFLRRDLERLEQAKAVVDHVVFPDLAPEYRAYWLREIEILEDAIARDSQRIGRLEAMSAWVFHAPKDGLHKVLMDFS